MSSIHQRVARGERAAMIESIDRYGGLVWAIASRLISDRTRAVAALEETFMSLWRNAHRFDPGLSSEEVFVALVARRRSLERLGAPRAPNVDLEAPVTTSTNVDCCPEATAAAAAIDAMDPELAQVLAAAIRTGMPPEDLAPLLGRDPETLRSQVTEAVAQVREWLLSPAGRAEQEEG